MKSKRGLIIISILIALFATAGVLIVMLLGGENKDTIPGTYADLYDALQNVETGDTVFAKDDIVCRQQVVFEKSMILDLKGNVLTTNETVEISEGATLTLINGVVKADKQITVKGGLVLGKYSEVVLKKDCVFGVADSNIKIDGGKIMSEYVTIQTFGDFEMTSGHAEMVSTYANINVSGGHIDSLSSAGAGKITGGDFGGNEITDPLRNYGTLLEIEGTATNPVTVTSKQWGLYTGKNTKTTLKHVKFFAKLQDIYAHGSIIAEGLELQGVNTFGGDSHFKNCNISCHENSDTSLSNMTTKLVLENCTVTGTVYGIQNFAGGKLVIKNTVVTADNWGITNHAMADAFGNVTAGVVEIESGSVTGIENNTYAKLYIKGGTITKSKNKVNVIEGHSAYIDVGVDDYGQIVISGGNITGTQGAVNVNGGKIVVTGGTINGGNQSGSGIVATNVDLQISGGMIEGVYGLYVWGGNTSLSGGVYKGGIVIYGEIRTLNDLLADGYRYESAEYVDFNGNNANVDLSVVAQ